MTSYTSCICDGNPPMPSGYRRGFLGEWAPGALGLELRPLPQMLAVGPALLWAVGT